MNVEASLQTYKIIVSPKLEYCSAISLDTMKIKVTETIEKVQNRSYRIFAYAMQNSVITGRLL